MKSLIKSILLISLSFSGLSFAEITSDSWDVDTRYSYTRYSYYRSSSTYSDTTTKKSASINLTLDGDIDKSTNINGIFTLDKVDTNSAGTLRFDDVDFVRQLYTSHTTNDGTEIKIGKQVSNYDNKKAIQDLRIYGGSCDPSTKKICDGVISLYVKKDIDENTELEFLVGDYPSDSKGRQYAAHIKHKKGISQYHLTLDRLNSERLYNKSSDTDSYTSTTNSSNSNISLAVEVEDTGKDKYYISYGRHIGNSDSSSESVYSWTNNIYSDISTSKSNGEYLALGKIIFLDKLFVKPSISHSKNESEYINTRIKPSPGEISVHNYEFSSSSTSANLYFEYPIESGSLSSYHGYYSGGRLYNSVRANFDILKDLSSSVSYSSSNGNNSHRNKLLFEITHAF